MPLNQTKMRVSGMVCHSCGSRIGKKLSSLSGVASARADYATGVLNLSFDPERVSLENIGSVLDEMGYGLAGPADAETRGGRGNALGLAGLLVMLLGGYVLADRYGLFEFLNIFPEAEAGMGYGMIFAVGLLTSTHCIAMCGGINLSQSVSRDVAGKGRGDAFLPTVLYAAGRVVSYAAIGGLVGGVGLAISFSGSAKGVIQVAAGVFMMLMGLNLMGAFPSLRRLIPRLPRLFGDAAGRRRGPLLVGLLNGLMPCGPLQTMQLFALSTGSPVQGALSMLLFALGTLPLTMGFGVAAAYLGRRFMNAAIRAGAVLVFVMGLGMLMNGVRLSGFAAPALASGGEAVAARVTDDGVQVVRTELEPGRYQAIRVASGIPLRWNMHAAESSLNGCNNRLFIPAFGIEKRLVAGDNLIEFTPSGNGILPYTCWMGMIGSRIIVGDVEDTRVMPEVDASRLPIAAEDPGEDIPWL